MRIWINGTFVERDEARISIFDASVQHAIGLFETMRITGGVVYRLDQHLERLARSCRELLLTERLRTDALAEAVKLVVGDGETDEARLRLTLTGGDLNTLQSRGESPADPTIIIVTQPPTAYPPEMFERGVIATIADGRLNPLDPMAGHKTLNYWPRIQALQFAAARSAGEALWFSVSNHLASGSVSNVFLVKDGILHTPYAHGEEEPGALRAPVLPGITRQAVIEFADARGIGTSRRMINIEETLEADEIFLTNASWGVLPVVGIEREVIADGNVGPVTKALHEAWRTDVAG
jgi:branched-subunit amino acid aminotransferase/4-amino-4-deoxychorismate lyase